MVVVTVQQVASFLLHPLSVFMKGFMEQDYPAQSGFSHVFKHREDGTLAGIEVSAQQAV